MLWHFCCYSDGKYYIMHRCCSLWQATYQRKGSRRHRSSGVRPKERAGDLHELFSLSNILCGKLTNLARAGPIPLPTSEMRKKLEVHKRNHRLIILCATQPGLKLVGFAWLSICANHVYVTLWSKLETGIYNISRNNHTIFLTYVASLATLRCRDTGV